MAFILGKFKLNKLVTPFLIAAMFQSIVIMLLSLNSNIPVSIILMFLLGSFIALFNVPFVTLLQSYVPEHLLGRVRGGMVALSTGLSSLGYAFSGVITRQLGIQLTILLYGVLGFIIIICLIAMKPFSKLSIASQNH